MRFKPLVLIYGADETGSAIAHRLFRARFRVVLVADDDPLTLFRGNSFAQAMTAGAYEVEGVTARKAVVTEALSLIDHDVIPLLTADALDVLDVLNPDLWIDANFDFVKGRLSVGDASMVIGVGSGFVAGEDCDVVINASPGFDMGRLIYRGSADPDPSLAAGFKREKISSETDGMFMPSVRIGQTVEAGAVIGTIGSDEVKSASKGVISALLRKGVEVTSGTPVVEVDLRGKEDYSYMISDWNRSISGGALEVATAWIADVSVFS